jgi:hypothetical protein
MKENAERDALELCESFPGTTPAVKIAMMVACWTGSST